MKKGELILELRLKLSRVQDGLTLSPEVAAKLKAAREELSKLRTRYTPEHPRIIELVNILADLEGRLRK